MQANFITIEQLLKESQAISLDSRKLQLFLNGVKLKCNQKDGVYKIYNTEDLFIGSGVVENQTLKRDVIVLEKN